MLSICHGWACPLVMRCGRSEFNVDRPPSAGVWTRHYQAAPTGEDCADFVPLGRAVECAPAELSP